MVIFLKVKKMNMNAEKGVDRMPNNRPQESIWGNINTCIEIALNIYYVIGKKGNGIMIPTDKAKQTLSEKALALGEEADGYLHYPEGGTMDIPMYEVLQKRVATCDKLKTQAMAQMKEIERDGKLRFTEYFGEYVPPDNTPFGAVEKLHKVRNGIYFVNSPEGKSFAVHESVADYYMSPLSPEFAVRQGEYLFYDLTTCAVALNELKKVFPEVSEKIVSEDSLYSTLNTNFPDYVKLYNDMVDKDEHIPQVEAPTTMFLQQHLDSPEEYISPSGHSQQEYIFEEQVEDYGFEP